MGILGLCLTAYPTDCSPDYQRGFYKSLLCQQAFCGEFQYRQHDAYSRVIFGNAGWSSGILDRVIFCAMHSSPGLLRHCDASFPEH
jgi:hypothetical protein